MDLTEAFTQLLEEVGAESVTALEAMAIHRPAIAFAVEPPGPTWLILNPDLAFPVERWRQIVDDLISPAIVEQVAVGAAEAAGALGYAFDVSNPLVGDAALLHVNAISSWAEDLKVRVGAIVEQGMRAGWSVREMTTHLSEVAFSKERAELIARTEAVAAANAGQVALWTQMDLVKSKTWVCSRDDKVRDSHDRAHGQNVPVNALFSVGAGRAAYPGDPRLPIEERVNCRCYLVSGRIEDVDQSMPSWVTPRTSSFPIRHDPRNGRFMPGDGVDPEGAVLDVLAADVSPNLGTLAEREAQLERIIELMPKARLSGPIEEASVDSLKALADGLQRVKDEYPLVLDSITEVGSNPDAKGLAGCSWIETTNGPKMSVLLGRMARHDEAMFRDLKAAANEAAAGGRFSVSDSMVDTISHEMGHIVTYRALVQGGGLPREGRRLGDRVGVIRGSRPEEAQAGAAKISEYATTNNYEMLAEAWALAHDTMSGTADLSLVPGELRATMESMVGSAQRPARTGPSRVERVRSRGRRRMTSTATVTPGPSIELWDDFDGPTVIVDGVVVQEPAPTEASFPIRHEQASSRSGAPSGIMEGVVDTFAFQSRGDSGLISLIPRDPESLAVEGGDPADELHVTVAYLGKLDEALDANHATSSTAARAIARGIAPFTATVTEVGMLGHDEPPAMVLFLDAPGALQAREIFELNASEEVVPNAYTYPDYKAHLTLGYGLDPADYEHLVGTEIVLDKVAFAWGDDVTELPLSDPQGVTTEAFPVKHNPGNGQFLPTSGVPGGPTAKDLEKANADDEDTDAWYAEGDEPPVITPIDSVEIGEGWDYRDGKWFDANGDLIGVSENGEEDGDIKWKPGFTPPLTEEAIRYITGGKKGKADFPRTQRASQASFPIRHDPRNGRFMPGPTVDAVVDEVRSALDSGLEIAAAGGEDGVLDAVNAEMDDIDPAVFDDQDAVELWDTPEFRETVAAVIWEGFQGGGPGGTLDPDSRLDLQDQVQTTMSYVEELRQGVEADPGMAEAIDKATMLEDRLYDVDSSLVGGQRTEIDDAYAAAAEAAWAAADASSGMDDDGGWSDEMARIAGELEEVGRGLSGRNGFAAARASNRVPSPTQQASRLTRSGAPMSNATATVLRPGRFAAVATANESGAWEATLTVEGPESGDGRRILPGALTWRDLPLPLMAMTRNPDGGEGHATAELCGRIDKIWRDGERIMGSGVFDLGGAAGQEAFRLVRAGMLRGVSVDIDSVTAEIGAFVDEGYVETIAQGRVMGLTLCPFPSFQEAQLSLIGGDDEIALAAAAGPPQVGAQIRLWVPVENDGVVASAGIPERPPAAWFATDQPMPEPHPVRIDEKGRIFGLVAEFGTCHIGFADRCITPDHLRSKAAYRYFRVGQTLCDDGSLVATGPIIVDSVHPDLKRQASDAAAFYAHTGSAMGDVVLYENEWGIVAAGAVRPDATPSQIRKVRGGDVSPDWRSINGAREVVALLAVNNSGFKTVDHALVASAGIQSITEGPRALFDLTTGEPVAMTGVAKPRTGSVDPLEARLNRKLAALSERIDRVIGHSRKRQTSFPIRHDPRNGRFMPGPTVEAVADAVSGRLDGKYGETDRPFEGDPDGLRDAVGYEMEALDPADFDQDAQELWDTPEFLETIATTIEMRGSFSVRRLARQVAALQVTVDMYRAERAQRARELALKVSGGRPSRRAQAAAAAEALGRPHRERKQRAMSTAARLGGKATSFPIRHDPRNGQFMPGPMVESVARTVAQGLTEPAWAEMAEGGREVVEAYVNDELDAIDPLDLGDEETDGADELWEVEEFRLAVADEVEGMVYKELQAAREARIADGGGGAPASSPADLGAAAKQARDEQYEFESERDDAMGAAWAAERDPRVQQGDRNAIADMERLRQAADEADAKYKELQAKADEAAAAARDARFR